jgi:hypothetical protein
MLGETHVTAVRNTPFAVQIMKHVKCYISLAIKRYSPCARLQGFGGGTRVAPFLTSAIKVSG